MSPKSQSQDAPMMQLRDFVTEAITQIADGVINANKSLAGKDTIANPPGIERSRTMPGTYGPFQVDHWQGIRWRIVEAVSFDLAVYASTGEGSKRGICVITGAFGLGGATKSEVARGSESRISFQIPIILPLGDPNELSSSAQPQNNT